MFLFVFAGRLVLVVVLIVVKWTVVGFSPILYYAFKIGEPFKCHYEFLSLLQLIYSHLNTLTFCPPD